MHIVSLFLLFWTFHFCSTWWTFCSFFPSQSVAQQKNHLSTVADGTSNNSLFAFFWSFSIENDFSLKWVSHSADHKQNKKEHFFFSSHHCVSWHPALSILIALSFSTSILLLSFGVNWRPPPPPSQAHRKIRSFNRMRRCADGDPWSTTKWQGKN